MVAGSKAIDVSCQTDDWDDERMTKYKKMKRKLIDFIAKQKEAQAALDKANRRIQTLEKNSNSRQKQQPKAAAVAIKDESMEATPTEAEEEEDKSELDAEMDLAGEEEEEEEEEEEDQLDEDDDIEVPATKRQRFSRRKRVCVERDESGKVVLPQQISSMTIISLGKVEPNRPGFHNERYIFPIGYHVERLYMSTVDPDSQTTYTCKVVDGGDGPLFTLTAADAPDMELSAKTATRVWATIIKKANVVRKRESANAISGPEYYGFSHPLVIEMIEELEGVDQCARYCRKNKTTKK